jgi:DNA-binding XRE family transcriptional regulator
MKNEPQIIYENGKPAFAVIPYAEYIALTVNQARQPKTEDDQFVPFVLSDYIKNAIRVARVEAGLTQAELAERLGVTQGYISKIEGHNFKVSTALLDRVGTALRK